MILFILSFSAIAESAKNKTFINNKGELIEEGKDVHGKPFKKIEKTINGGHERTILAFPNEKGEMTKKTVIVELGASDHDEIKEYLLVNGNWTLQASKKVERRIQE